MSDLTTPPAPDTKKPMSGWTLFYIILSIVMGIIAACAMKKGYHLPSRFFGFILGTVLAYVGILIGDILRKIAVPDAIMTSGMTDTLKQKLFWFIGPQVIGSGIGAFIGAGLIGWIAK